MTVKLDCPKVIANALFEVQSKIGTLGYDSANSHQKYKYVSIDKYYEKMRPILSEAGIMIIPDETHSELSADRKVFKATYQFTINSGEKDDADILPQGDLSGLTPEQIQEINSLVSKAKLDEQDLDALHKWLKVKDLSQADPDQYENLISALKRKLP